MKNLVLSILVAVVLSPSCNKSLIADGTPLCIKKEIRHFEKNASCSDARVDKFEFQSEVVYVFSPGSCGADMTSPVLDSDCNKKGQLGGISGNSKINGQEFSIAKFIKNVWMK